MPVRVCVLGEIRLVDAGETDVIRSAKQRLALGVLVCHRGKAVSADRLIDALWGDDPPTSAMANLRSYISKLRKRAGDCIEACPGGYRLLLKPGETDLDQFEFLAEKGHQAGQQGDADAAARLSTEALALWRGPAFGELCDHPMVGEEAARLSERRLSVIEQRIDADLARGHHDGLTAELTKLVAEHPMRERFRAQLMLALYRSGRQAEALEAYHQGARLLAQELGVDPGQHLRDLHQSILTEEPALAAPAPDTATRSGVAPVPAQLPADLAVFTGRAQKLVRLRADLLEAGDAVAISAISGAGGIGKSALAIHFCHQVSNWFPDGQLYLNLQGTTPDAKPLKPIDALGRLLRALGMDGSAIPLDVEEAAAHYRTRTHDKRMLIILDNAYDTAQIRLLIPGSPTCAVMITSRLPLSLDNAHHHVLNVLTPDEAVELLAGLLGEQRVTDEPRAAARVAALCAHLPLAISIAAARLNARKTWSLAKLAERLEAEDQRLSELVHDDRAVRASLSVSYRDLDYPQARAFRLCALPGGPDLDVDAAAALLDLSEPATEDLLDHLVDLGLLESRASGRYRYHDLIRLYAHEQTAHHDPPIEQDQALHRLLAYYTAAARMARQTAERNWTLPSSLLPLQRSGRTFSDVDAAKAWLQHHGPHLVNSVEAAIRRSSSLGLAADQLYALEWLKYNGLDWGGLDHIVRSVADAAVRNGDQRSETIARYHLGNHYYTLSRPSEAAIELRRAAELANAGNDLYLLAEVRHMEAVLNLTQRRITEAISAGQEAADLYHSCGNLKDEAFARSHLARCYQQAGRHDQARAALDRAADVARQADNPIALGAVQYARGINQRDAGQHDLAIAALTEALDLFRQAGNLAGGGNILFHLAETHRQAGRHREAAGAAEECLTLARRMCDEYNVARALTVLGRSHTALGEHQLGRAHLEEAHKALSRLGAPETEDIHQLLTPSAE
ncbi:tetratricopeptide repeat protein [Nonomuraea sp. K274]|uniref:Tetratricopeptide repeat protein n=1 Tax=Nonomuraea cypriaca TaxID=1187855 RepID=A0A931AHQ2_9ACTN|nr:BTAD domain-containing putative transcriptional regulator [Nonomuraea cypriaca]MBF8190698.1 tetratricopeptide repeat protein [Nonomuraea cypriaca]